MSMIEYNGSCESIKEHICGTDNFRINVTKVMCLTVRLYSRSIRVVLYKL